MSIRGSISASLTGALETGLLRRAVGLRSLFALCASVEVFRPCWAGGRRSDFGRAVSRILSARLPGERIICLSSQYPGPIPSKRKLKRAASWSPIWPCSRWGFPCPGDYSTGGGLLPRLFTLAAATEAAAAVCFLWHCPSDGLSASPPACIPIRTDLGYAASRPVEFGLSSPGLRRKRFSALPKSEAF